MKFLTSNQKHRSTERCFWFLRTMFSRVPQPETKTELMSHHSNLKEHDCDHQSNALDRRSLGTPLTKQRNTEGAKVVVEKGKNAADFRSHRHRLSHLTACRCRCCCSMGGKPGENQICQRRDDYCDTRALLMHNRQQPP